MSAGSQQPSATGGPAFLGEIWGGFAAMLVALPSAIAYGIAVFGAVGPQYVAQGVNAGIIGAAALGLVAPLLGGAPRLISAPCAPAAAVLAALGAKLLTETSSSRTPGEVVILLMMVTALAGTLQLVFGMLGVGRLIKYIPFPVVSGYLSGVALLIFASQVPTFLGLSRAQATWAGVFTPAFWQPEALGIGTITIAAVVFAPRLTKAVPAAIIGLAAGVVAFLACRYLDPSLRALEGNSLVIGPLDLQGGLASSTSAIWSALDALRWRDLQLVAMPALTLAVLLSVDTLKTCVVLDALTLSRHNSNRELIGQGAGNTFSALLGGMPGAGTMGATLVNRESGGTTRWSGVCEGVFVLAAFLLLGRWLAWIPVSALAGLLVVVAFRMFEWRSFGLLRQRTTWLDFSVIATVVVIALSVNLIAASGAGVGLAILLFIREQISSSVIRRKISGDKLGSTRHRLSAEQAVLERCGNQTTICELQGSLFFGTTDQMLTELDPDLNRCRYLVLDWRRVRSVDFTALHMLERFESMLNQRDGVVVFTRLPKSLSKGQDLRRYFEQAGVIKDNVRIYDTLDDALEWIEDRILSEEMPSVRKSENGLALSDFEVFQPLSCSPGEAWLERCVVPRSFPAGDKIFRAGDRADELFLIRRGTVRIALPLAENGHHNLASFGSGDFFGEMAFLDGGARSADAIAMTATDVFVVSRSRFDEVARSNAAAALPILASLARALAFRMRHADAEIRALYEA